MKQKGIFWIIMCVSILVGVALVGIGASMGGTLGNVGDFWDWDGKEEDAGQAGKSYWTDENADYQNIQNLDFDLSACDVEILEGDEFQISGSGFQSSFSSDKKTWYLRSPKRKWYHWFTNHTVGEWTITLPRGRQFDEVKIDFAAADLEIEKLATKSLSLEGGAGDAAIGELVVSDSLHLTIGAGDLDIESGEIAGTSQIKCGAGDMDLALSALTGTMKADCGMGDMDLILPGAKEDYKISTQTSMGDIEVLDHGTSLTEQGNTLASLELDCSMGDIQVDFR